MFHEPRSLLKSPAPKMNRRDTTRAGRRVASGALPTTPLYAAPGIRRHAALAARYAALAERYADLAEERETTLAEVGPAGYCSSRHRCYSTQESRVQSALDDVVSNISQAVG